MQPVQSSPATPPVVCDILGTPVAMTDYARAVALVKAWASEMRRAFRLDRSRLPETGIAKDGALRRKPS
jgi:hypothetical protein